MNWNFLGRLFLALGGIAMIIFSIIIIALGGALDGAPMLGIGILMIAASAILGKLEWIQFNLNGEEKEQKTYRKSDREPKE